MTKDELYTRLKAHFGRREDLDRMTDDLWNTGKCRPLNEAMTVELIIRSCDRQFLDFLQRAQLLERESGRYPTLQEIADLDTQRKILSDVPTCLRQLKLVELVMDGKSQRYHLTEKGRAFLTGRLQIPEFILLLNVTYDQERQLQPEFIG